METTRFHRLGKLTLFIVPEIQGTTQDVARAKVKAAAEQIGGPCITEVNFKVIKGICPEPALA
jgi:hypothetical protein